jgi:acyl carrier protein
MVNKRAMTDTLNTVKRLIGSEVVIPITAETSFGTDLELESIELVVLLEKLQAEYGDRVDFVTWLSGKDIDELAKLTVGQLTDYIDQCLLSQPME